MMLTVVFGSYAVAVLAALLVAGRLSDHLGRRPVLVVAALGQALAELLNRAGVTVLALHQERLQINDLVHG